MVTKIINGKIIAEGQIIDGSCLYFSDGIITAITDKNLPCDKTVDAGGRYVSPGFIDIHSHGGGGADFTDGTSDAFLTAAKLHLSHGTTTIIPTATSCTADEILLMCECYHSAAGCSDCVADMPGIHLEGPYFSDKQCGAQNPGYVHNPEPAEYNSILDKVDCILRWSAAPELEGANEFAAQLKKRGILPAIGHSDASFEQVKTAYVAGFTHITHLYSCMSTVHRVNAYRHAGVVESAYLIDGMTAEIIADGVHLPAELLEFVYRFKGADKTALVTDSMRGAGMPEGKSILGSLKNGMPVIIEDGVAKLPDRSAFAGSVATMDRLVRNMINLAGASLTDSVKMASATPAKIMKLTDRGLLKPGLRADIAIFDEDINIYKCFVRGKEA